MSRERIAAAFRRVAERARGQGPRSAKGPDPVGRAQYRAYMVSDCWARTRKAALARAGRRCQSCGWTPQAGSLFRLEVHHRTYARLGHELPADLVVLCTGCHAAEHGLPAPPGWEG